MAGIASIDLVIKTCSQWEHVFKDVPKNTLFGNIFEEVLSILQIPLKNQQFFQLWKVETKSCGKADFPLKKDTLVGHVLKGTDQDPDIILRPAAVFEQAKETSISCIISLSLIFAEGRTHFHNGLYRNFDDVPDSVSKLIALELALEGSKGSVSPKSFKNALSKKIQALLPLPFHKVMKKKEWVKRVSQHHDTLSRHPPKILMLLFLSVLRKLPQYGSTFVTARFLQVKAEKMESCVVGINNNCFSVVHASGVEIFSFSSHSVIPSLSVDPVSASPSLTINISRFNSSVTVASYTVEGRQGLWFNDLFKANRDIRQRQLEQIRRDIDAEKKALEEKVQQQKEAEWREKEKAMRERLQAELNKEKEQELARMQEEIREREEALRKRLEQEEQTRKRLLEEAQREEERHLREQLELERSQSELRMKEEIQAEKARLQKQLEEELARAEQCEKARIDMEKNKRDFAGNKSRSNLLLQIKRGAVLKHVDEDVAPVETNYTPSDSSLVHAILHGALLNRRDTLRMQAMGEEGEGEEDEEESAQLSDWDNE